MLFKNFDEVKEIIFDYLNISPKVLDNEDDFIDILKDIEYYFDNCYNREFDISTDLKYYNRCFNFWYQCSLFNNRTLFIHFNCTPVFSVYQPYSGESYISSYVDHCLDVFDWVIHNY